ncbi:unnamed protein product, partial [Brenthis ino]
MAEDLILNEDVHTVNSYCNIGINIFEEQTNLYEETMDDLGRKRIRDEENGGEWQQVVSHTKKKTKTMDSSESDFIQVCITDTQIVNSTPSAKDYVYMPQCTIDASPSYSEVLRMPQENHKAVSPSQNVKKPSAKKKKKRVQISENIYADFSTDSDIDLENENKTPFTTSEEENKQQEEYQKVIQEE